MFNLRILLAVVVSFVTVVSAHNVLLPAHGKRCFFEDLKKGDELAVSFQFGNRNSQSSEQLKGDFTVWSPSGTALKTEYDVSHGDVSVKAKHTGKHKYCFSNERSSVDTKDVSFNIHGVLYVDINDPENDSLDAAVRRLAVLTNDVKNEQGYIVVRERTHRNTAESTNSRVKWWSIMQLLIVLFNSAFQIYYLKRFFEVKSIV
ncbi:Emp24p CYBJADRAFT_141610 [Cyberlindnera jadinii NRRL Y-1542]|uniref:GOLD domain-containing protein n=1 Tax=Cyberlindnera jadinii (strain ATCC 18201 / CBS 1600 / BCRC 20928 / JCM 3617 / NBRC 0987 / NRRL Y-1542) TaxID=983966 RepID=A0A1E4RYJ8_CYBJN|nr:hypothetical protein CYBJADRAFT_141610 [Cyberlindnera jadinii NRRL Y-1542]ODV72359.1 hypothetical protein CYBJADRAFT_141610 [Cyberlindnera jadinii NRRL Y-1542]